jgi:hypothetical protein
VLFEETRQKDFLANTGFCFGLIFAFKVELLHICQVQQWTRRGASVRSAAMLQPKIQSIREASAYDRSNGCHL